MAVRFGTSGVMIRLGEVTWYHRWVSGILPEKIRIFQRNLRQSPEIGKSPGKLTNSG